MERNLEEKYKALQKNLSQMGGVVVAFSGGVDSTFLLRVAHDVLGDRVLAITASSCSFPERELREAQSFCRENGIRHLICESEELDIEGFRQNPENRCYLCKRELFEKIRVIAGENGFAYIAEGSNLDDDLDYRPGQKAVKELCIRSPLRESGFCKSEIRELSKKLGLPTWNKQSFACLSSRFVYGETISKEKLEMVDRAEQLLLDLGFHQVRVRIHGMMARIEISADEFGLILKEDIREKVSQTLKQLGFSYVSLDLEGYRTGSMNRSLK